MTRITTHILDTSLGQPAADVRVWLESLDGQKITRISETQTDADGRAAKLTPEPVASGHYRLCADIGAYFKATGRETLYHTAIVDVMIDGEQDHYHLPLLISPYSYSTYRGS
ncbi:hydroxyisourate hydrolase [Rahnella sp. Lac-M11]|jgi:5-hydroxyisourate hydrolase|uniref:5-hydroxyisourate hydrolase n=1 Tax=Rahnella contaminans TaxID=2703882 RepID=A0A6M2B490_9GAMM|nr:MULTISPECIES: hydroxyisourate hydrolase [Rahnella]MBU9819337.1 hydroxyisourate hydrolase [Rahnella sp. BCC 1045]MCS3423121.1 5-hydroxyisourate hydrolase [Rahnella sp. BIGb0603]MDF1896931.1 hydroxyisourate hydrolase [Rahnella contaminans]NGX87214.1 hydroxyisourate hydrolase [Rahnella contaminans]